MKIEDLDRYISDYATLLGFRGYGAIPAEALSGEREHLERYLSKGYNGTMGYLAGNIDIRENPSLLLDGAKSIMVLLIPYKPAQRQREEFPGIATYAYGEDYHTVVKERLRLLGSKLTQFYPDAKYRVFTDSAPIFEKALAVKAGLGFIGKNTLLISKSEGLHTFIGVIITDVLLKYNKRVVSQGCGSCRLCLNACPTGALREEFVQDSRLCISYRTIESKEQNTTDTIKDDSGGMIFGCDKCIDSCPWSSKGNVTDWLKFKPLAYKEERSILTIDAREWHSMTEESFKKIFKNSPLKRRGLSGIKHNLNCINKPLKESNI